MIRIVRLLGARVNGFVGRIFVHFAPSGSALLGIGKDMREQRPHQAHLVGPDERGNGKHGIRVDCWQKRLGQRVVGGNGFVLHVLVAYLAPGELHDACSRMRR